MRLNRHHPQRGMTVAFSMVIALVMSITIASVAKIADWNSHQAVYFKAMNSAYQLAETGLGSAIAQLIKDPDPNNVIASLTDVPTQSGSYQNQVFLRNNPVPNVKYIITTATKDYKGREFKTKLHSYVRVSNVADYFAAINSSLIIGAGADISQGKVYAIDLEFQRAAGFETRVLNAEYVNALRPMLSVGANTVIPTDDDWPGAVKTDVRILAGHNQTPTKLQVGLLFPQIFTTDMIAWRTKAGPHTVKNVFEGEIYPPEYERGGGPAPDDPYRWGEEFEIGISTPDNARHIYYYNGDMFIKGRVHGQVLFVAEGNIFITGNLEKFSFDLNNHASLPGGGATADYVSSSTAHQAVLVTRGAVFINNSLLTGPPAFGSVVTQKIHALILAPNLAGTLRALPYQATPTTPCGSDDYHRGLRLDFLGSMILGSMQSGGCQTISDVFRALDFYGNSQRNMYAYDTSLKTNPPPYLPALAEIYYTFEETEDNAGLFGS